jgi:predicted nucleotide-binding protein
MIVAEVLIQRSPTHSSGVPITTGGLGEPDLSRFVAIIEGLQKTGTLETRWRAGNLQDAPFTINEQGKATIANVGADVDDPLPSRQPDQGTATPAPSDHRKVFVVHGRNDAARNALFTFLRTIGLHPLEWSEVVLATGKASPYIGEVLEKGFSIAQAVVVLMTPDDDVRLREKYRGPNDPSYEADLTPQPRPNVLLEGGMALGLFPDRTVIVELGQLRPVSDIGGRHVIRMNDTPERRHELAQRLQTAGCAVNMTGTDWYKAGTFSSVSPVVAKIIEPSQRNQHGDEPAFLYITNRANKPERIESGHKLPWICPEEIKEGDTIWVFVRGEGLCYKWQTVSKPYELQPPFGFGLNCSVVFLGKFYPPITLQEMQEAVSEEEWGAPYKDFFGFACVRIPVAVVAKILRLRKPPENDPATGP